MVKALPPPTGGRVTAEGIAGRFGRPARQARGPIVGTVASSTRALSSSGSLRGDLKPKFPRAAAQLQSASSRRRIPQSGALASSRTPPVPKEAPFSTSASAVAQPAIHDVFEKVTGTWQYVIADPATGKAVLIDPVLDYDPATQAVTTTSADALLQLVKEKKYTVERILETHAHADHLTAASYLQSRLAKEQGMKPPIGIGKRIGQVQELFSARYGVPKEEYEGVFDNLFDDDEIFKVGELEVKAIHLPGHTPDHLGYKIGDNVFCGDSIFHHDIGTARSDFPGGSELDLWTSGRKLLGLGDDVKIWPGHDYPPAQRKEPVSWVTVGDHRHLNKHLKEGITKDEFVAMRKERDEMLGSPRLLHQSLQMNIRAGRLPKPLGGRHRLLHLPLRLNGIEW